MNIICCNICRSSPSPTKLFLLLLYYTVVQSHMWHMLCHMCPKMAAWSLQQLPPGTHKNDTVRCSVWFNSWASVGSDLTKYRLVYALLLSTARSVPFYCTLVRPCRSLGSFPRCSDFSKNRMLLCFGWKRALSFYWTYPQGRSLDSLPRCMKQLQRRVQMKYYNSFTPLSSLHSLVTAVSLSCDLLILVFVPKARCSGVIRGCGNARLLICWW